jgi:hypothetical protein
VSGVPDRLCIWPLDRGRFGLDASFQGSTGYAAAEQHEEPLRVAGITYGLKQELDGSWTIRLGPLTADAVHVALDAFLAGRSPAQLDP